MIIHWDRGNRRQPMRQIGYGVVWSWIGTAGPDVALVTGPVCWAAGEVYHPGFQQGEAYHPGFQAGQRDCDHDG